VAAADSALLFLLRAPNTRVARRVPLGGLTNARIELLAKALAEQNFTMLRGAAYFLFQDLVQPWLGLVPPGTERVDLHPVGAVAEVPFGVLLPAVPETEDVAQWPYWGNQMRLQYHAELPGSRAESAAMPNFPARPQPLEGALPGAWEWRAPTTRETILNVPPAAAALPRQPTGWALAAAGYSAWVGHSPGVVVLPTCREPAALLGQLAGQPAFADLALQGAARALRLNPRTAFPSFWAPAQAWQR
jgi:hypothetical protein